MKTEVNLKQKFHNNKLWNFIICKNFYQIMVHNIDSRWHHILPSIISMHEKLVQLGFVYYNSEIQIVEPEEKQKYV